MKILNIEEYEKPFLEYCKEFYALGDRNMDWFNPDLKYSVPNSYKRYPYWSFLVTDDEELIAMAAIQTHFFPKRTARLITRTFYNPKYRRKNISYDINEKTPALRLFENQIAFAEGKYDNLFFSVEFLGRKHHASKFCEKINNNYGMNWKVLEDLHQTYPNDDDSKSWQVVASPNNDLPLKNMTIEQWKRKYDNTTR